MEMNCRSVAFTYNEPIIFAEYAIDVAEACHRRGLKTVAVTAGYISPDARPEFFGAMDAANVDLKAFTDRFYRELCGAHLEPVLDTLMWVRRHGSTWLEVTTLLIPGQNDDPDEVRALSAWCANHLGTETPLHFTAHHPVRHHGLRATPASTLERAREIAMREGMKHVYLGNVQDAAWQSTFCAGCGELLLERNRYTLGAVMMDASGRCVSCGQQAAGHFELTPAGKGQHDFRVG
jgi:pyruvate formate lyase activating enzyme